jgi:exosome complex exonuclease DIS3/RRP44
MQTDQSQTSIEKRLKEISSKLSNVLTKDDSALIKNIIRETLDELKEKLLSSVIKRIEIIEGNMFDQAKEVESLKQQLETKNNEIESLKQKEHSSEQAHKASLNDLEQYGRRNNVRITGLPNDIDGQTSQAVAEQSVDLLNKKLGLQIEYRDIDVAHRLGKFTHTKNRPAIVKFVRRQTKIDIMKRAKLLKGTGIFINEDLTKTNAEVLASLRLKEPTRIEKAWSYEGKLFAKYKGSERHEQIHFDQYHTLLSKPWPSKDNTYARKVSSSDRNLRSSAHN